MTHAYLIIICDDIGLISIPPLHSVDAAYEGVQKRTFLVSIILIVAHLPFVAEIIVLHKQLSTYSNEHEQEKPEF